jgi:hypothetical protein
MGRAIGFTGRYALVATAAPEIQLTTSAFIGGATTTGNLITVTICYNSADAYVDTVVDEAGNTYQRAGSIQRPSSGYSIEIWYAYNITGHATCAVTARLTKACGWFYCDANEWSDVMQAADCFGGDSGNAYDLGRPSPYDFTSGSVTPATEGALILGAARCNTAMDSPPLQTGGITRNSNLPTWYYIQEIAGEYTGAGSTGVDAVLTVKLAVFL